ncbi:hypothetical protein LTR78_008977 [Recurvomyces mirabilis]|uniref:HIT domain-containing protein n=2 Tax=Recurvomyces mirabilis TaxID=574656 RepID=A0AAE0TU79_9PEZI|nr:hypothetical protein LTR78_008977 [Recurvomyces mirabilis]
MSTLEDHYPIDCPFCKIAAAYPSPTSSSSPTTSPIPSNPDPEKVDPQCHLLLSTPHVLAFLDILPIAPGHILLVTRRHYRTLADLYGGRKKKDGNREGGENVVRDGDVDGDDRDGEDRERENRERNREMKEDAQALGEWMPILSRALCSVTGIEDWNLVQNNGERAAQVVPHVHFHFIPRYQEGRRDLGVRGDGKGAGGINGGVNGRLGKLDMGMLKSWRMFGRGTREELDDEEGVVLARSLRGALRRELGLRDDGEEGGVEEGKGGDVKAKAKAKL